LAGAALATPLQDIPFQMMDGKKASLKDYAGKVVLVVNVASKCGLTPQYAGLEDTYKKYGPNGLVILASPVTISAVRSPERMRKLCNFAREI